MVCSLGPGQPLWVGRSVTSHSAGGTELTGACPQRRRTSGCQPNQPRWIPSMLRRIPSAVPLLSRTLNQEPLPSRLRYHSPG